MGRIKIMKDGIETRFYDVVERLQIPDWAFKPDQWSLAFLRGLYQVAQTWSGKKIWEVGVGTGINLVILSEFVKKAEWFFSDFDSRATFLAIENEIRFSFKKNEIKFKALEGSWDLTLGPNGKTISNVDVVYACIPQVPVASDFDLMVDDRVAHYYLGNGHSEKWNEYGLGLCASLLCQLENILSPKGCVVLNLGGRPGISRLLRLFSDHGYIASIVYEEVVTQHSKTSLQTLATMEGNGHEDFEFFLDESCSQPLNAREAEALRVRGIKFYHKIYVIEGTLMT